MRTVPGDWPAPHATERLGKLVHDQQAPVACGRGGAGYTKRIGATAHRGGRLRRHLAWHVIDPRRGVAPPDWLTGSLGGYDAAVVEKSLPPLRGSVRHGRFAGRDRGHRSSAACDADRCSGERNRARSSRPQGPVTRGSVAWFWHPNLGVAQEKRRGSFRSITRKKQRKIPGSRNTASGRQHETTRMP